MIEVTIKRAAIARGVKTQAELARLLKITDGQAGRLWRGGHNATLDTIGKVCDALGEIRRCGLSDLIAYRPEKAQKSPARRNGTRTKAARKS